MKIVAHPVYPPIPIRNFDWCAYDDDSYELGRPVGYGATKEAAIADLLADEEHPERCDCDECKDAAEAAYEREHAEEI